MSKKTHKNRETSPANKTRRKLNIKEPTTIIKSITDSISSLNPFNNNNEQNTNIPVEQSNITTCNDRRCPNGYRCNTDKICYKLKSLELELNRQTLSLFVDGNRGKTYDIEFLNTNFERISTLKNGRIDGKKINGIKLKEMITDLKKTVTKNTKSTYYGTLNDEMIIQIIYLESMQENISNSETDTDNKLQSIPQLSVSPVKDKSPVNEDNNKSGNTEPDYSVDDDKAESVNKEDTEEEDIIDNYELPDMDLKMTTNEENIQDKVGIIGNDIDSKKYNKMLQEKELLERDNIKLEDTYDFLYPELDDPNFNSKIAKRKEFNDTQYDGTIYNIKEQASKMCNAEFELLPHQVFVKNFLSFQTPYNSLLLYHGLGTGKTCSSIGVAEEMRNYMKQTGITQRIMIIASPNVQNNFRLQLFDESKLLLEGGIWNLNTCIGNTLLQEINPTQLQNIPKEKVVSQINALINQYYVFMGYGELANFIKRKIYIDQSTGLNNKQQKQQEVTKIQEIFNNRLVIIDEVHNIRIMQDNKESKKTATLLMHVCKYAENMRLLLLSATPMFNNHREIIWITNLLNMVDKRSMIQESHVFDKEGNFIQANTSEDGKKIEGGEELLRRKLTGYISYVRGENPYTFPYRIYPNDFAPGKMIQYDSYPSMQMNNKPIESKPSKIPLYMNVFGDYQKNAYDFILKNLLTKSFSTVNVVGKERNMPTFENMESFGYTHLREPLLSLNIIYPNSDFDVKSMETPQDEPMETPQDEPMETPQDEPMETPQDEPMETPQDEPMETPQEEPTEELSPAEKEFEQTGGADENTYKPDDNFENNNIIGNMIGKNGLSNIVSYKQITSPHELRYNFNYKPEIQQKYGNIFNQENIKKYSGKMHNISTIIKDSKGIIMIYSQYLDGGVVPMALVLEEMGFTRYGSAKYTESLFETAPTAPIDVNTFVKQQDMADKTSFKPAKYVMITGDKSFSPNNLDDLKYVTNSDNKNGENVKVILITKAAAEGLDFKNIRQLHILEPWYNMNRPEQIIGRAVRNLSHCALPFEERNVEIYLHATQSTTDNETADLYIYRYAENKAMEIGKITRILKEIAIDCILNYGQTSFTIDNLNALAANQDIKLQLSSNQEIDYKIGDKEGSSLCDYMNCDFVCSPNTKINDEDINQNTYGEHYVKMNYSSIAKRIRDLFKEQIFYKRELLINAIQIVKKYPIEQIDYVLSRFVENKNNYVVDKYGRNGYLINTDDNYGFQPVEISNEQSSIYERTVPINYKPNDLSMELPIEKDNFTKPEGKVLNVVLKSSLKHDKLEKTYEILLNKLKTELEKISVEKDNHAKNIIMETAESDWYKHLGYVYMELENNINIPIENIQKYAIYHWLDSTQLDDKLVILHHLYKVEPYTSGSPIEHIIKTYFDEKLLTHNNEKAIALSSDNHIDVYIQIQETRMWKKASLSIVRTFAELLRKKHYVEKSKIQPFVGFMHLFKNNEIVFKLKEIVKRNANNKNMVINKGFKCCVSGKKDIIKFLNNKVLANNPYPRRQDKGSIMKYDVNINAKNIMRIGLCVITEMIMRYYNECPLTQNEQVWFFDPEETLANDLIKI